MSASTARQILDVLGPSCHDVARRGRLLEQKAQNGIDFIEFEEITGPPAKHILHVHFLLDLPADAHGLPADLSKLRVHGGTRITGIAVTRATRAGNQVLDVEVDQQGDYSPYLLAIGWSRDEPVLRRDDAGMWRWDEGAWHYDFTQIDRPFSVGPINFRPGCPIDFDCSPARDCPPGALPEPALDYLARDYASFRQLLLDLVAQRHPTWTERSPADIGMALVELFAYEGDHLSYFQDAIANETYLDTARQRVSAKRHAKLVDYQMHDGRNAWTFVHLEVTARGAMGPGQQLVTQITSPMRHELQAPGTLLKPMVDDAYRTDAALAQVRVFETSATAAFDPLSNELYIHAWGNEQCCLPRGTRTAQLYAIDRSAATPVAVRPPLKVSDYLLLEEVRSPANGAKADADPAHRQVVRILRINPDPYSITTGAAADAMHDRLFLARVDASGEPLPVPAPPAPAPDIGDTLPLLEVTWRALDALTFPLCVSATLKNGTNVHRISVARGNLVPADHGRSVVETIVFDQGIDDAAPLRLRLSQGPLTMQCAPDDPPAAQLASLPPVVERTDLQCDVRHAKPAILLQASTRAVQTMWHPVPDLLSSSAFKTHFVADVDDEGRAVLRFGDGEYGQRFVGVTQAKVWYRVGNGRAGNIGADALQHIVVPVPAPGWPAIEKIRNPLPAWSGEDPELIEQVRQYAPAAFRATQYRAVTEQDYQKAALTIDGVAGAVASFRWTGSWYTVFVGIDPTDPDNVLTNERGVTRLNAAFKQHVLDSLSTYRLAGYDLEIRSARYVPLDITIELCAKAGYFRGDVAHAVSLALGTGVHRGRSPGFFNPANLTFGQPVYLSRIYAALGAVDGVESATVTVFHPHGRDQADELTNGVIPIGTWEIARLDNDPSNMENGTLTIRAGGGS
jgi:hypothetical protein